MTTCRYDREFNDYLLPDGSPCLTDDYGDPTRHCTARRTCPVHIGADELTCPRCIGRARADLRAITGLAALMLPEAVARGSVDTEAAMLAGPAADAEAWTWRKVAARQGRSWHVSLVEDDDETHPALLLGRWAMMIAEDYGHDLPTLTIDRAADYLERQLARIAHDPEQDFGLLARELRACRSHMEAVLRNSTTPERGAPCPDCQRDNPDAPAPRLVRHYGHWCEEEACEKIHYTDDSGDVWRCRVGHQWSEEDYRLRVAEWYDQATSTEATA